MRIVGAGGRVGSTVSARLAERGVRLEDDDPDLVLLCVPDRAIVEVASGIAAGPWIAHVSGATPLSALAPHERRFVMHPLQSFSKSRGPEQLDGAWAAVSGESDEACAVGFELAEMLGLRPFELDDAARAAYHAGAAVASNYLVTLRRAAGSLLEAAGAPPEALDPLMRGVVEGGFELTGPIARGDWETVARHLDVVRAERPELEQLYVVLARATAEIAGRALPERVSGSEPQSPDTRPHMEVCRTVEGLRRAIGRRSHGSIGLVPTMGSLHEGHRSLLRVAREECNTVVMSLFVNPAQFTTDGDLRAYPHDEERDLELAAAEGVDFVFAPSADEMYPPGFQTWVELTELGSILEGEHRPGHFRGVATIVVKLFTIVRPDRAYFGQKDAQQAEVIRQLIRDLALEIELRVLPTVRDCDGLALSSRNALLTPAERERALALPRALATRDPAAARRILAESNGLVVDYVEVADFDPPVLAGAARVGSTRLIDNVPLEGEKQ
ncbi:MAG: pantoate--beta-alanine ligase [Gaiellaceae bacterium]